MVRTLVKFLAALAIVSFIIIGEAFASTVEQMTTELGRAGGRQKIELLIGLADAYAETLPVKGLDYASQAVSLSDDMNDLALKSSALMAIGDLYSNLKDYQHSVQYFNLALNTSVKANKKSYTDYCLFRLAMINASVGDFDRALDYYRQDIKLNIQAGNLNNLARAYNNTGNIYVEMAKYDLALDYFLKSLKINEESGNRKSTALILNNIGVFYFERKNFDKAFEYYKNSLDIRREINDKHGMSQSYNNLGNVYQNWAKFKESNEYYQKSLRLAMESGDSSSMASCYVNIGNNFDLLGNYPNAEAYFFKGLEIFNSLGDLYQTANAYNNIGNINIKLKNFGRAHQYLDEAMKLACQKNFRSLLAMNYFYQSILHSNIGEFSASDDYYKVYSLLSDSIYTEQAQKLVADMQVKYETQKKARENELLRVENQAKTLDLKVRQRTNTLFISIAGFIALLMPLTYGLYWQKKKSNLALKSFNEELADKNLTLAHSNKKLEESKEYLVNLNRTKDKFFSIIAHDLKNPFTSLVITMELFKLHQEKLEPKKMAYLINGMNSTIVTANELLENLLQWSRTQTSSISFQPEKLRLEEIARDSASLVRSHAMQKNISVNVDLQKDLTVLADKNMVNSIIRNLMTNAVKFSYPGSSVTLSGVRNGDFAEISVIDKGVGIDADDMDKLFRLDTKFRTRGTSEEAGTGLGLILCKEFVEKNNGTISVISNPDSGTTFKFTLPAV